MAMHTMLINKLPDSGKENLEKRKMEKWLCACRLSGTSELSVLEKLFENSETNENHMTENL